MNKIQRVSLFFRVIFQIALIVIPIMLVIEWINAPKIEYFRGAVVLNTVEHNYPILGSFTPMMKFLGFMISLIPTTINLLALYFLIKLFKLYERDEIFSIKNVRYIRNIGCVLLIGQCLHPVTDLLMSIVMTWNNHLYGAKRIAAITFSGTNFSMVLIALLVILISWIMAEGHKLREESQLTI